MRDFFITPFVVVGWLIGYTALAAIILIMLVVAASYALAPAAVVAAALKYLFYSQ